MDVLRLALAATAGGTLVLAATGAWVAVSNPPFETFFPVLAVAIALFTGGLGGLLGVYLDRRSP